MSKQNKWRIVKAGIILALVAVDIIIKAVVEKALYEGQSFPFIKGFINFTYVKNTGAAFSLFSNATIWLTIFSIILITIIIFADFSVKHQNGWYHAGFMLILAGAIGNLYDRIFYGFVRDFIEFDFMEFGIFNVADMMLTAGVICYSIFIIFFMGRKDKKNKEKEKVHE